MKIRLSQLFADPALRAAFAAAERDQGQDDAFAVSITPPKPPRTDGAIAKKDRELCVA
jgi:hypothetical protein